MRILLVDDHVLFREGLVGLIDAQPAFEVVGEAGTVMEAITCARRLRPDLILMDFTLPDGTGLDATEAILEEQPESSIVFLTFHDDDERLFAAIRKGARGYLLKNVSASELLAFIRGVENGHAAITPDMTGRILAEFARTRPAARPHRAGLAELTSRELEVFQELAAGSTNLEIAQRLVISQNTVKNHVRSILAKLGLKNRREAAGLAERHGFREPPPHLTAAR